MPIKTKRRRRFERTMDDLIIKEKDRRDLVRARVAEIPAHSHAVIRGLRPRLSASVDSWCRRRVPLHLSCEGHGTFPVAFTDFTSINIKVPEVEKVESEFFGLVRGLVYHETGHMLHTAPFKLLCDALVIEDNSLAARTTDRVLHSAWNMLEDQRMEVLMTKESENLVHYYSPMVLKWIYGKPMDYLLVAGRTYLPRDIRAKSRTLAVKNVGENKINEFDHILRRYCTAKTLPDMMRAVMQFADLFPSMNPPPAMGEHTKTDKVMGDPVEKIADRIEIENKKLGDHGLDQKDIKPEMDAAKNEQPMAPESEAEADQMQEEVQQAAEAAAKEAEAERDKDDSLTHDKRAYNEAFNKAKREGMPTPLRPGMPNHRGKAQADTLNRAFVNLMRQNRDRTAPMWSEQQRTGIINVMRYKTRQHGDQEYRRNFVPSGNLDLPDLAVSVVLDGSGSMHRSYETLGIAAFAMKKACEEVEVPCTVTTFSDNGTLLWEPQDRPTVPPTDFCEGGGTEPQPMLDLIDGQRHDRKHHLVIIMTDGLWDRNWSKGSQNTLATYAALRRDIVLFFYRMEPSTINGIDSIAGAYQIDTLADMPRYLTRYLTRPGGTLG